MDRSPLPYETSYEGEIIVDSPPPTYDKAFAKSLNGILKLLQIILCCVTLICTYFYFSVMINFDVTICLVISSLLYVFYLFMVIRTLPGPRVFIEFSILILCEILWFITFVIATVNSNGQGSMIAIAVFSVLSFGVILTELVCRFRVQRRDGTFIITMTGVTTVSDTKQPIDSKSGTPYLNTKDVNNTSPHIGFPGSYSPNEQIDDGYIMP